MADINIRGGFCPGGAVRAEKLLKLIQNDRIHPGKTFNYEFHGFEKIEEAFKLMDEKPKGIINIVDATNLSRSLFFTTQLLELGIPVVVAINMMDIVNKKGDQIDLDPLLLRFVHKIDAQHHRMGCRHDLKEQGEILLLRFATDLEEIAKVELMPKLDGKKMNMILAPKGKK